MSITKEEDLPASVTGPEIARGANSQTCRRTREVDSAVSRTRLRQEAAATVGGLVVYHDNLCSMRQVREKTVESTLQIALLVMTGNHNAYRVLLNRRSWKAAKMRVRRQRSTPVQAVRAKVQHKVIEQAEPIEKQKVGKERFYHDGSRQRFWLANEHYPRRGECNHQKSESEIAEHETRKIAGHAPNEQAAIPVKLDAR